MKKMQMQMELLANKNLTHSLYKLKEGFLKRKGSMLTEGLASQHFLCVGMPISLVL